MEYRCPKKGEFYVSGAIPEAYRARNDLPSPYWIVRPTHRAERVTTFRKGTPLTMTIAPAPDAARVAALVDAAEARGAMPEGYCFCSTNRIGDDSKIHEPECRDLRAAIAALKED